jgi:hypothetical protein
VPSLYYNYLVVGEPVEIDIGGLFWDQDIDEHFARHWVDYDDLMAVVKRGPLTFFNLPGRGGSHVMIGPDHRDRILYVSIMATEIPGIWEPVTGWESRLARRIWARERGGQG